MISALFGLVLAAQPSPAKLALYVDGEGVLRFEREGRAVFAREAVLEVKGGRLVNALGHPLLPEVAISGNPERLEASLDGVISAVTGSSKSELGRLVLARFPNDIRLIESRGMLIAADRPKIGSPGEDVFGVIRMGARPGPTTATQKPPIQTPAVQTPAVQTPAAAGAPQAGPAKPAPTAPQPRPEPSGGKIGITVRPQTEASGNSFLLGDLADITGPDEAVVKLRALEIGATPALGVSRPIDRLTIEARIARAGFMLDKVRISMPDKVQVTRKGQPILHEDFVKAAIAAAAKKATAGVMFESAEPGPVMVAPLGQLILTAGDPSLSRDKATVVITVSVDGKRFNSRTVALKISSPLAALKPGDSVKLRVKSGGASVETTARIRSIDLMKNQAVVESSTGAVLTAQPGRDGALEVIL